MSKLMVRLELRDGTVKWRAFADRDFATDHATLCRAFGLDPIRAGFDLPSTARGVGSAQADQHRGPRLVNGYVTWPAQGAKSEHDREPIGTLTYVREGERIPDVDPFDMREFFKLERKVA